MTNDNRPTWFTVERFGLHGGAFTRRWTELRREGGKVLCQEWTGYTRSFDPSELLTEEQAGEAIRKGVK